MQRLSRRHPPCPICFVDLDAGDVRTDAAGDLLDILAAYRRDERED
jgi:hypothetical protein